MFRDYVAFEDALACYEYLADKKKGNPEELRVLDANFRMYARLRAQTKNDDLARNWIAAIDTEKLPDVFKRKREKNVSKETIIMAAEENAGADEKLRSARAALDSMIGLKNTKSQIDSLVSFFEVMALRKQKKLVVPPLSMHMAFLGAPGTGKTTVARHMAGIMHALGLIDTDKMVEVDRSDLIGTKIGHTEEQTRTFVEKARGGVLFIDEAHTLLQPYCHLDFGHECADILCKLMEDYRHEMIFIFAGYPEEMKKTILLHKGIKSRINHHIEFPDYADGELIEIFKHICSAGQYVAEIGALDKLAAYLKYSTRLGFGVNARDIRNIFEKSIIEQSKRLAKIKSPSGKKLKQLMAEDIALPAHAASGKIVLLK